MLKFLFQNVGAKVMETIAAREFKHPKQMMVQERIIKAVTADPDSFIEKYIKLPNSFSGKYVCADLFKEVFPEYNSSREARVFFNTVVHNSAAVLASEHFKRLTSQRAEHGMKIMFLTGVPGAGKTSYFLATQKELGDSFYAVFEGQLASPEPAIAKIHSAIGAGYDVGIYVVHTKPLNALDNTIKRFNEYGRGASVFGMAAIQGELPNGLQKIKDVFNSCLTIEIHDKRTASKLKNLKGWDNLDVLRSEGNQEQIKNLLISRIEEYKRQGIISDACYRQAMGLSPEKPRIKDNGIGL
jgi:hypothetical protein